MNMRKKTGFISNSLLLGALCVLIAPAAHAQQPTPAPETSLLGVPLLASFRVVLKKFGQPNEIQVGVPYNTVQPPQTSTTGQRSGLPGMPGMGGPGMGYPGMPGMGGPGMGYPGMPGAMGRKGGMPGMPGMGGPGMGYPGMPTGGYPGMGRPGGLSRPGINGRNMPGSPGAGYPGMGGAASATEGAGKLSTWWYHFPKQGVHYSFLFNAKGQVIQIQAYGMKAPKGIASPRTRQGVQLGSPLGLIIHRYGWSNDGTTHGDYVQLEYGIHDRIAFQVRHNHVVGIVLGVVTTTAPTTITVGS